MKEIRLHGRGGQGVVKAAQILVQSVVENNEFAHFIPFFGVERKGSPVFGFVRIDDKDIRCKCQVYDPHCLLIMDETLLNTVPVYDGLRGDGIVVINSKKPVEEIKRSENVKKIGVVDATGIALDVVGKEIPNTAMLGALAKVTGWIDWKILEKNIDGKFGNKIRSC